jgi:hypothetical protein
MNRDDLQADVCRPREQFPWQMQEETAASLSLVHRSTKTKRATGTAHKCPAVTLSDQGLGVEQGAIGRAEVLVGPHGGLGAIGGTNLAQDRFDVNLDRRFRDLELPGNDLVGFPTHQGLQDDRLPG